MRTVRKPLCSAWAGTGAKQESFASSTGKRAYDFSLFPLQVCLIDPELAKKGSVHMDVLAQHSFLESENRSASLTAEFRQTPSHAPITEVSA